MRRAPTIWHLLGLAVLLWGGEYVVRDLWEPDEARFAYVAREMHASGNWAVPHRHGVYYAHKPPLMFWLINAGSALTGGDINGISARLPSLLGMVLALWAIVGIARLWVPRNDGDDPDASSAVAWRAVLVAMTTYLVWAKGGMGQIDALLVGLEFVAFYHLIAFETNRRLWRPFLAYTCMGLAVLAKGPVGFAVPLGMYVASTFAAGRRQPDVASGIAPAAGAPRRFHVHYLWGPLVTLMLPAAWLLWVYTHHPPPGYLEELLFDQNVQRAAGNLGHAKPIYYFLIHFPLEFMPWTPVWFFLRAAYREQPSNRVAMRRLLAGIGFVLVFFSVSVSKRELYILPAYPLAALLVAIAWPTVRQRAGHILVAIWCGLLAFIGLGLIGAAIVDAIHPMLPLPGVALIPPGVAASLGAALLLRRYRAEHGFGPGTFLTFAGSLLAVQIAISLSVYSAMNPLKVPHAVVAAAERYLSPDEPILLYRTNGEIFALHANRPGRAVFSAEDLERFVKSHGHALLVVEQKNWQTLPRNLHQHAQRGEFTMGHKRIVWAYLKADAP